MNYAIAGKGKGQKRLENYIHRQRLTLLFCQPRVRTMLCSRKGGMGEGEETDAHQHLPQPRHHVSKGVSPRASFHTGVNVLRGGKACFDSQSHLALLLWACSSAGHHGGST